MCTLKQHRDIIICLIIFIYLFIFGVVKWKSETLRKSRNVGIFCDDDTATGDGAFNENSNQFLCH